MTKKMKKFETGKKYVIGHVDFAGDVTVEVISRTSKFAIFNKYGKERRLKLHDWGNREVAYCDDCGHQELEMDVCPVCGSRNLTKIDRMNGYLAYSRVHGDSRLSDAKMAEIAERKSM